MERPNRTWDPNAPSILWAHEIRRENIQLVNQIDNIKTELSSTTNSIKSLDENMNKLTQRVQEQSQLSNNVQHTLDTKLVEIEAKYESKLATILTRTETLESDNSRLREKLDIVEAQLSARVAEWSRFIGRTSASTAVHDGGRWVARCDDGVGGESGEIAGAKRTHSERESGGSALVSKRLDPWLHQTGFTRTLSGTTWDSLSDLDAPCGGNLHSHSNKQGDDSDTDILKTMAQNGRTLEDYISYAEQVQVRICPGARESVFVEAFMLGLDSSDIKARVEKMIGYSEASWGALMPIVRSIAQEQHAPQTEGYRDGRDTPGLVRGDAGNHKENRKRRCIPIVPADEEDALIIASMFRSSDV